MKIEVFKVAQNAPNDLSELDWLVQSRALDPKAIVAILGKTEGNGCVNDFTRGFAVQALKTYFQPFENPNIVYVMSGGTEGVLSPHLTVFTRQPPQPEERPRFGLALGVSRTRNFSPTEIGTLNMVEVVAAAVQAAIADAHLTSENVHFVQVKCPLIISSQIKATQSLQAQDSYKSMAYSRGASALGVAVALGELSLSQLKQADICSNYSLYSRVASTSAGVELQNCEILVMGNSTESYSDYVIAHQVMQHALDKSAVQQAIKDTNQPADRIVNIFAKAEADPSGKVLGRRHTMLDDSDINHTRMARAVVGAVIAAITQDPMVYVSGGSEHQGPAGGGPVAVIARTSSAKFS